MPSVPRFFRLRIRTADNTADALVITSVRGGANPYLSSVPSGDGQEFDPLSGQARAGAYTGLIADGITSGTDRVVTSQLEDSNFRQQLIDRRAFVEWSIDGSTWSGGTNGGVLVAGYLTSLRLASGAEYEYEVSDATRAEREYTAFTPQTILDAGVKRKETVAEFLTRWPNRGCVLGGPVRGGFLDQPDRGGWEMVVDSRQGPSSAQSDTWLRLLAGYVAPNFERITQADTCAGGANDKTNGLIQPKFYGHRDTVTTFDDAQIAPWSDLVIELVGNGFYQPALGSWYFYPWTSIQVTNDWLKILVKYTKTPGIMIRTAALGTSGVPSAGTKVRVRAFTANPSEVSPIYWTGHPVDLLSTLWTEAGVTFSSSSLTTVRNTLGADLRLSLRITEPQPLRDFLERTIYGPFGIGVRSNDNGELEAFPARIPYATAPTTEITSADVWTGDDGASPEVFNIATSTAISKLIFEHQRLIRTQDANDPTYPDGYVVQSERFERENADPGAVGQADITYTVVGMVHSKDSNAPNISSFVDARAWEIFDRWGRGIITGEVAGLRGGSTDSLKLGDEALNKHPYLPNHNKRLGDDGSVSGRAMQIVAQTWDVRGYHLKLADSGPNAQPFATQPIVTIAASADHPHTIAEATVTNAATLNTAGAGLRLQMAVTTGAAPASTDYTDVGAYGAGLIPTTAIPLPAVTAGRSVFVRALATKAGSRPSTFSTVVSVTLGVVPPVTGLSVSPSGTDGSLATATWTPGDGTSEIDVYLRLTADPSTANVRQRPLPPSSARFVIEGLGPGGNYTVTVQARDAISGDVSVAVTAAFTAGGTTATLPAPVYAFGFAGTRDASTGLPHRDGVFGIGVVAAAYPGFIEAAIATETSVGAGTYGSFVTDGHKVASALGDWTEWSDVAPNDGLRRQVKVRQVGDGLTASSYTSPVTVLPWTPQSLPAYPTNIILSVVVSPPSSDANAQTKVVITVTAVDPQGGTPQIALTALTSNASVASGASVGTYVGSGSSWTINRAGILKGSAVAEFTGDTSPLLSGFRAAKTYVDIPEQGQQGAPVLALTVKEDGHVETKITGNNDTGSYSYAESTSAVPSDATARAGTLVNGRVVTVTSSATLALGDRYFIKVVPYNAAIGAGGAEGPIVEGSVDRQNQSNNKTIRSAWDEFRQNSGPSAAYNSGYLSPSGSGLGVYFATVKGVPVGVPITEFRGRLYRAAGLGTAQLQVYKCDASGGITGPFGAPVHTTTGWQTVAITVTETSDGSNYLLYVVLEQGGETSPSDVRLAWCETDYTAIDLSKSGAG